MARRKRQSSSILKENSLKQKLENYAEKNTKISKRYRVNSLILQAGYDFGYVEYLIYSVLCSIVSVSIIVFSTRNIFLAVMFVFLGYSIPSQYLTFRKNKRGILLEKQSSAFLQMVIKRYSSINDFKEALRLTTIEFEGVYPLYDELKKTYLDIELGVSSADAMSSLGRRINNKFVSRFADYLDIVTEIGTPAIRENLLNQAYIQCEEDRKEKELLKKEISAPVRESYIMLGTIPGFALYQVVSSPGYVHFMTRTTMGQVGVAIVSFFFIGSIWIINNKIGGPLD